MRYLYSTLLLVAIAFTVQSCDFLDIVPKNNPNYKSVFSSKTGAKKALHGLYSWVPDYNSTNTLTGVTDEFSWPPGYSATGFPAKLYWGNNFSSSSGSFNFWNRYQAIRYCFQFLKNIDNVPDISNQKIKRWKAQANFLIGYYYFLLFKNYGPIPLIKKAVSYQKKFFPKRVSVDSTEAFIVKYLNKAISDLPQHYSPNNYGKPTSVAAKALKARVLIFAASPLFNGDAPRIYESLSGPDGKHLFPRKPDPSKWKKALNAVDDAINAAHDAGKKLYYYTGDKPPAWNTWTKQDQSVATNLFKIVKKWNNELIWGYTGDLTGWQIFSYRKCISPVRGLNSKEVTIEAIERFYTKDGLPINVDPNYDYNDRFKVKPGDSTAYLNRDRSPRFYASVAFDRGKYYINGKTLEVRTRNGDLQGLINNVNDGGSTGSFLQKFTNPKTVFTCNIDKIQSYPFPIIRLADLYLLDAEAYNEVHGKLSGKALTYFNDVRKRAGIPTLQDSWSKAGGVPDSKGKIRQIIHRERYNELAFEGHWYYDMRRWTVAKKYMDQPIHGWNVKASSQDTFYQLQSTYENIDRKFDNRFYFLPIPQYVLNVNKNLIQNPGY